MAWLRAQRVHVEAEDLGPGTHGMVSMNNEHAVTMAEALGLLAVAVSMDAGGGGCCFGAVS